MIHIIIPVHNRWPETQRCLSSLRDQAFKEFAVYVVDDGSTDGTAESIRRDFPGVRVIEGSGELWWTGAVRTGVDVVLQSAASHDHVMTLNNDVVLAPDTLSQLHNFVTRNPSAIANALSIDAVDRDTVITSGSRMSSWVLNIPTHPFRGESYAKIDKTAVQVDMLTGRSTLYPVAVFPQCGNFDSERFPHYGGDVEFTLRAKRKGRCLFLVPAAVVYLNQGTTGLNAATKKLTAGEMLRSLVSVRSATNLFMRTKFALHCCPWYAVPSYTLIMYVKILVLTIVGNAYVHVPRKRAPP